MKIQEFTGGLATRLRPQFLAANEAAEYTNINNLVGTLAAAQDKDKTDIEVEEYCSYYIAKEQWVSRSIPTSYLEFNKKLYMSDGISVPQVTDGIDIINLGIIAPGAIDSFVTSEHADLVKEISVKTSGTTGLLADMTYYAIVNSNDNKYSAVMEGVVDVAGSFTITNTHATSLETPVIAKDSSITTRRTITLENPKGFSIGNDGVKVYRLYEGEYYLVGSIATATTSLDDTIDDISANETLDQSRIGVLQGTYQYATTYYNSRTGTESALSVSSEELIVNKGGTITLTGLPVSDDPQVDKKRVYRIGGNITTFTRVIELPILTASLLDNIADVNAEGSLASTIGDGQAPEGLDFLVDYRAMLFGGIDNKLMFTPIGVPTNWPALNYLQYESAITGIAATANGILVMTKYRTHLVTGSSPETLATQLLSGDQGCIAFSSIANIGTSALWASTDGLCTSEGANVTVITRAKLGKLALTPVTAVVHDEIYYLSNANGMIVAFNFGVGKVFEKFDFDTSVLVVANDILYGWNSGFLYSLFTADTTAELQYLSPRFVEGRVTELKTYKKVYIYAKGDIIIDIIIDDNIVATKAFSSENGHTVQVPQDKQRGFFIQFAIRGTGEVYELEYVVGNRQND